MKKRVIGMAVVGLAGLVGSSALAAAPSKYDRPGNTARVTQTSSGEQAKYPAVPSCSGVNFGGRDISDDGRYIVFASDATNLVPNDTNLMCDVFRLDRRSGRLERVSVADGGAQALDPLANGSSMPTVSANGRFVAFESNAINLVPGDTNLTWDVFVRDMVKQTTTRVSLASSGTQGNGSSRMPSISADGRHVAFESDATNLVAGDTNGARDIFVRDVLSKVTTRESVSSGGGESLIGGASSAASISKDGRYVAFSSTAPNLVPGNTVQQLCQCAAPDVYWRDRKLHRTVRVLVSSQGAEASYAAFPTCTDPAGVLRCHSNLLPGRALSSDGRSVLFESTATNLVPNDSNFQTLTDGVDVFVHDVVTGRTDRVSVDAVGHDRPNGADAGFISSNGRYVSYIGLFEGGCAPSPVPDGVPAIVATQVEGILGLRCNGQPSYVYDRLAGSPDVASATRGAPQGAVCTTSSLGGDRSYPGSVSPDGRFAVFVSNISNLVPGDTNNHCDTFLRDRGPSVGAGALTGRSSGSSTVSSTATRMNLASLTGLVPGRGAGLVEARVVPRVASKDIYLRWDLSNLAAVTDATPGGLLCEMRFTSGGQQYAVRAQRVPGPDFDVAGGASFGLFRETTAGLWTKLASLKGGYGTIGESVVTAVPLSELGLASGGRLSDVTAYTAIGSYLSGPTKVLDSIRLSR